MCSKGDYGCTLGFLITANNENHEMCDNRNIEIPIYATFDLLVLEALLALRNQDVEKGLFVYSSGLVAEWIEMHYQNCIDGDILSQSITALHQAAFAGMARRVNFCNQEYFLHVGPNVFDMQMVREEMERNEPQKKRARYSLKNDPILLKKESLPSRLHICFCHLNETDRARAHILGCVSNRACPKCKLLDLNNNCPNDLKRITQRDDDCDSDCNENPEEFCDEEALLSDETLSDTTTTTDLSYEGLCTQQRYTSGCPMKMSKKGPRTKNRDSLINNKCTQSRPKNGALSSLSRLSRRIKREFSECGNKQKK